MAIGLLDYSSDGSCFDDDDEVLDFLSGLGLSPSMRKAPYGIAPDVSRHECPPRLVIFFDLATKGAYLLLCLAVFSRVVLQTCHRT